MEFTPKTHLVLSGWSKEAWVYFIQMRKCVYFENSLEKILSFTIKEYDCDEKFKRFFPIDFQVTFLVTPLIQTDYAIVLYKFFLPNHYSRF